MRWDNEALFAGLRKAWGVTHLDEVLRGYENHFVLTELPPKKNLIRDCAIATHPWSRKELEDPDPRALISVTLAHFIDDAKEMSAAMDQITGLRILA